MDELPEGIDSKFRYVMLVAKRAEQLLEGALPKERLRGAKPARQAMHEIAKGMVHWQTTPPSDGLDDQPFDLEPIEEVL